MQTPHWIEPGIYGAACGAAALAIIGFSWGGWVTGSTAQSLASDRSKADVVTALSAICVDQSRRDPQLAERVAAIKAAASWERSGIVMKNGWATMPGTPEANPQVAKDCADKVMA